VAGVSLFVYGTLLNDDLVRQLTGRIFPKRAARLDGFARVEPPGGYPYITRRPGARVDGCLLEGVDAASLARFDAYEGDGYLRTALEVTVADGGRIACESYVGRR
jgi:gamma-glutamylcyclotransferase (GGCT)/AIG2-like uncharacterized protein YtfP